MVWYINPSSVDSKVCLSSKLLNRDGYFKQSQFYSRSWIEDSVVRFSAAVSSDMGQTEGLIGLGYYLDGLAEHISYQIRVTSIDCNYGGKRWYFECPLSQNGVACGKRVGCLYLVDKYFGCRHCYKLTYESQSYSGQSVWYGYQKYLNYEREVWTSRVKRETYKGKKTKKAQRRDKLVTYLEQHPDIGRRVEELL